jgi:hypothetical protein
MLNKGSGKTRKNPPIDAVAQKSPHEQLIPHGINADAADGSRKTREKPPEGIAQKSPPEEFIHHSVNADAAEGSGKHARKNPPEGIARKSPPEALLVSDSDVAAAVVLVAAATNTTAYIAADAAEGSVKMRKKPPEGIAQKSPPEELIHHSVNPDAAEGSGKHARKNPPEVMSLMSPPEGLLVSDSDVATAVASVAAANIPQPTLRNMEVGIVVRVMMTIRPPDMISGGEFQGPTTLMKLNMMMMMKGGASGWKTMMSIFPPTVTLMTTIMLTLTLTVNPRTKCVLCFPRIGISRRNFVSVVLKQETLLA